jgi:membrane fusion protein, copper/silver efflux system
MNDTQAESNQASREPDVSHVDPPGGSASPPKAVANREARRWWIKLFVQPALFLAAGVALIASLGLAQRQGWITAGGSNHPLPPSVASDVRYICPMMCTPPQNQPGRCPVCAMELVPAASGSGDTDEMSIQVDPVARRVAHIRTAAVQAVPHSRRIRAIGEIRYDEGALATISAYVDGRLDRLYADYTGVHVKLGDRLAWLYSPELYSTQVELTESRRAMKDPPYAAASRLVQPQQRLYEAARQRLIELGMTEAQVSQLEQAGEANSRMHLCSPISGTVIEKLAVEGQYVKTGQPIYRVADLSAVWLMLELFPEDAATIRYGQRVTAEVQSLPGRVFPGRVAFVDPIVNPKTRTVGVRVVVQNEAGLLRIGDYAKAQIEVPLTAHDGPPTPIYDQELAGKWIGPRHPHVIEDAPGVCRICGTALVPATAWGFTSTPIDPHKSLVVPRDAVLMAGQNSVLYVETEPGRFEIRPVVLGPSTGGQTVILRGVTEGEQVAVSGNFLIDSQMQLAGNPSVIDPTRAKPRRATPPEGVPSGEPLAGATERQSPELTASQATGDTASKVVEALARLSPADRKLAEQQKICPVTEMLLGSMGLPVKVDVNGRLVFICCAGCRKNLLAEPEKHLAKISREPTR